MADPRRRPHAAALALLVGMTLPACAPHHGDAWSRAIDAGASSFSAGQYADAAAHYREAAAAALRIKDRDEALFLEARTLARMERWDDARRAYAALAALLPAGPRAPRAAFEEARLAIEHGDESEGWALIEHAIERYPSHGSTRLALTQFLAIFAERRGEAALRERITSWLPRFAGTDSEQRLEYEIGRSFERSGELAAAHAALLTAARRHPYPKGSLTDDALFVASEIAERMGDAKLAIVDLEEMLVVREVATGGSYERPRFPAARMRIGELYRDKLRDFRAARDAFHAVRRLHASSLLADDATWQEALMAVRLGDVPGACEVAERLVAAFTSSRYVGCVSELCPTARAPAGRECADYIRRELSADGGSAESTPSSSVRPE